MKVNGNITETRDYPNNLRLRRRWRLCFAGVLTLLTLLFSAEMDDACAQSGTSFNQRDDQYRLLGLKRAKETYDAALQVYERQKQLREKGLIAEMELEQAHVRLNDAEVNYQQSLLAVLFEQQYITVTGAVKYQTSDGGKRVRLTVSNPSGISPELQHLIPSGDPLFRSLQPDVIYGVYLSLLNDAGAVISQPYETRIDRLEYGKPVTLDFMLLQDLDVVTVLMIYGKGAERRLKLYLQKDTTRGHVAVQSRQFSQEAELGGRATYDLTFELFSGVNTTFQLEAVNLPGSVARLFRDADTQARLNQFKFSERSNTQKAAFEITLPDRPDADVVIDETIPFYALVIPTDRMNDIPDLKTRIWTQEQIEQLGVGYARLELLPRGVGRLLIRAPQLFQSVRPDESVEIVMDVVNEGSRPLTNVEIKMDLPLRWTGTVDPPVIPSLDIDKEQRARLILTPPPDIGVGRYEIRIRTSGFSDTRPVNGEDKTALIEVQAPPNILGTIILTVVILALVAGMVVFGIRLSRR